MIISNLTAKEKESWDIFFFVFSFWLFWNRALKACTHDTGFCYDTSRPSMFCIWKKMQKQTRVVKAIFLKPSKNNLCPWEDRVSAKLLGLWFKNICNLIRFVGQWIGVRISGRKENKFKIVEQKNYKHKKRKTMRKIKTKTKSFPQEWNSVGWSHTMCFQWNIQQPLRTYIIIAIKMQHLSCYIVSTWSCSLQCQKYIGQ